MFTSTKTAFTSKFSPTDPEMNDRTQPVLNCYHVWITMRKGVQKKRFYPSSSNYTLHITCSLYTIQNKWKYFWGALFIRWAVTIASNIVWTFENKFFSILFQAISSDLILSAHYSTLAALALVQDLNRLNWTLKLKLIWIRNVAFNVRFYTSCSIIDSIVDCNAFS